MSHHVYITKGVVFEKKDYGETHAMLSVFTEELGMVDAFAQGLRRPSSKLKCHAQEYTFGTFGLVRGKAFWRVTTMASDNNIYRSLSSNAYAQKALAKVFSLIRRLVSGEEKNKALFYIIEEATALLSANPHISQDKVSGWECVFVSRILHNLGYMTKSGVMEDIICMPWTTPLLDIVGENRPHIISRINVSLSASGL